MINKIVTYTSNSATVKISGMDTVHAAKIIDYFIKTSSGGSWTAYSSYGSPNSPLWITDGKHEETYENLLQDTTYYYKVEISYLVNSEWEPEETIEGSFTTLPGGFGGNTPTYDYSISGSNITVYIINADTNYELYAYLYDNPNGQGSPLYSSYAISQNGGFAGIPDGTYYLNVYYIGGNTADDLRYQNDISIIYKEITIGGSSPPTPSSDFYYNDPPISINISENYTSQSIIGEYFDYLNGKLYQINIVGSGDLAISFTNVSYYFRAYITSVNRGYDTNGVPIINSGDYWNYYDSNDTQNFSNISNTTYYIWVSTRDRDESGYFTLNIIFTPSINPSYTCVASGKTLTFSVSNGSGLYFRYYVKLKSNEIEKFDSQSYQGHFVQTNPYTINSSNIDYNTTYIVNVSWAQSAYPSSGDMHWIGSQEVTTGSPNGYVYIYTGSQTGWKKAIPYIYDGSNWRQAIPYIYDGSNWKQCGG